MTTAILDISPKDLNDIMVKQYGCKLQNHFGELFFGETADFGSYYIRAHLTKAYIHPPKTYLEIINDDDLINVLILKYSQ